MNYSREQINSAFGKVLKGVVKENDQTQQSVADHLGQNVATVNRIFGGKRDITATQFLAIADLCREDPRVIIDRVLAKLRQMSEVPSNVTPLRRIEDMTNEEREALGAAAINDDELGQDEPDAP